MMRYRLWSAAVLVPLILGLTFLGGIWFLGLTLLVLTLSGYEYAQLLRQAEGGPSALWVISAIWLFVLEASFLQDQWLRPGTVFFLLGTLAWAILRYERGRASAVMDWAWTVAGGLYLGWVGAHFVLLRNLEMLPRTHLLAPAQGEGLWWATLALSTAWLADTGAYLVGQKWGQHKLCPRVSPFKTWEGFAGGVIWATVSGVAIAALMQVIAPFLGPATRITLLDGMALGLLIGVLAPLGDLGESLIKRHVGAKDSGQLIPGHGGMFDRIDSLLWAAVIAFYYATWIAR
jgi:phosphatidate cytidylyltransferase